jgi:hypothetical protein
VALSCAERLWPRTSNAPIHHAGARLSLAAANLAEAFQSARDESISAPAVQLRFKIQLFVSYLTLHHQATLERLFPLWMTALGASL